MTSTPHVEELKQTDQKLENPYFDLARNAQTNPKGYFAISKNAATTNEQADRLVRQLSTEFTRLGIQAGDRIAVDVPEILSLIFIEAAMFHGVVSAEIPSGEISDAIGFTHYFSTDESSPYCPPEATYVHVNNDFMQRVSSHSPATQAHTFTSPKSAIRLAFTSGTTGRPKAFEFSLGGLRGVTKRGVNLWMEDLPTITKMGPGSVFGLAIFLVHVESNVPMLLLRDTTDEEALKMALGINVRSIKGAPSQISSLVAQAENQGLDLSNIESIFVAGASMSQQAQQNIKKVATNAKFYEIYGSSEALIVTENYEEERTPGYVGKAPAEVNIQIVAEDGTELPTGKVGLLRVQTPWMISEYVGSPGILEKHTHDGWFYPGDRAYVRADGGLVLAGRESEVLNAGGVKVDPSIIEEAALQAGTLKDCAAFVIQNELGIDEFALACVPLDPTGLQKLANRLNTELGVYAPKLIVEVNELPYSQTGKIVRHQLAQQFSQTSN